MKVCPVCGCTAFDDAKVCFGCLHPFTEEDDEIAEEKKNREESASSRFLVSFEPAVEGGRVSWTCSVEQVAG